jgi:lysophospholipase L1-like esterase
MVLLAFGIPELLLRMLDYPPVAKPMSGTEGWIGNELFWGLKPNLRDEPFLHKELGTYFKVSSNSRSMRYREIPAGRQPKTVRILALGDSTTFGWGVEQDQTYPAQLEQLLQAKHPDMSIEVIDGGVPGYTSFQGLYHFRKYAAAYEPDIVLFGYIVQDARMVPISDKAQAIKAREAKYLADNPLYRFNTYRLLRDKYNWLRAYRADQQTEAAKRDDPNSLTPRVPLADYRENIELFKSLTDAHQSRLVLFGFPLEVIGYTKEHRKLLKEMADELKLDHFDPSNVVHEEARERTLYFPKDKGHPNADGCRFIAEQLAAYIEDRGLIAAAVEARR